MSQFNRSSFTLTFAVEILGIDVFHDCNEGWLDLGPCTQGMKIHAKNDKNTEVYLPPLAFGERRYFAPIQDSEQSLLEYVYDLIWKAVESYIPASYLDTVFDVPHPVKDVRHQDAILYHVKECILGRSVSEASVEEEAEVDVKSGATKATAKAPKDKEVKKKVEAPKVKFEMKLSGDTILASTGRLVPFETIGDRPPDLGEIIVLVSSNNLPASDDLPIVFVNIEALFGVPVDTFKKLKISQLYTKWSLGGEEHCSEPQFFKANKELNFNDHHAVPLPCDVAFQIISDFLDTCFQIELRGIRYVQKSDDCPKFFGYDKEDRDFGIVAPKKPPNDETDIIIATTKIDVRSLAKGFNVLIRGEFDLYPPSLSVENIGREAVCSNDINGIRSPVKPEMVVQSYIILEAQMTLQVCMGFVGCRPHRLQRSYSRMFCLVKKTDVIMAMLRQVTELNDEIALSMLPDELLTGFSLDIGDTVIFYAEGLKDGAILKVWEKTEDFYPDVKPVFSTSSKYSSRIYPSLLHTAIPFAVLKMCVPLSALLACPPVYARPVLPVLTRFAALKFGRLVAGGLKTAPSRCDMPTAEELVSFRLELCVPPRPINKDQNIRYKINFKADLFVFTPKKRLRTIWYPLLNYTKKKTTNMYQDVMKCNSWKFQKKVASKPLNEGQHIYWKLNNSCSNQLKKYRKELLCEKNWNFMPTIIEISQERLNNKTSRHRHYWYAQAQATLQKRLQYASEKKPVAKNVPQVVGGKSSGIVTTARITHATPAALYAHAPSRYWEDDSRVPPTVRKDCKDIAMQLVENEPGRSINVIMGGGRRHFLPTVTPDPEHPSREGRRLDGRNLAEDWAREKKRRRLRAQYIHTKDQLAKLDSRSVDYLLGLFEYSHMEFNAERGTATDAEEGTSSGSTVKADDPSLADMTRAALSILLKNDKGFFLLIEGGRIDHAHHYNNPYRALDETLELETALLAALERVNPAETLIVVTADHGHVMTFGGQATPRGHPVLGADTMVSDIDGLRYTTLLYGSGPGHAEPRAIPANSSITSADAVHAAAVPRQWATHGGEDVPIYALGPMATILFAGVVEQSYIPHAIAYAACLAHQSRRCQEKTNFTQPQVQLPKCVAPEVSSVAADDNRDASGGRRVVVASSVMSDERVTRSDAHKPPLNLIISVIVTFSTVQLIIN
ncbi:hypothetical protein MSG28_009634 [Choristoneura fumiferana]|uniref:Uncharacterized protein n=1 Tax=Choristoneura fumiferana TaxID=7141 RepID=A0ACC0JC19_CHOFU|nr:hypothetical protein MSG28_009634 [Choristoneura fumiferana]